MSHPCYLQRMQIVNGSDTFNGLMMIPNLIGVLVLSPIVMRCTKNYVDRILHGKDEKPMLSMIPEIQEKALKEEMKKAV